MFGRRAPWTVLLLIPDGRDDFADARGSSIGTGTAGTSWCAARLSDDFAWMGTEDAPARLIKRFVSAGRWSRSQSNDPSRGSYIASSTCPLPPRRPCASWQGYLVFGDPASGRLCRTGTALQFIMEARRNDDSLKIWLLPSQNRIRCLLHSSEGAAFRGGE